MPAANTVEDLNLLRVDQVGSLVVPGDLVAASDRHLRGETSESELRDNMDGLSPEEAAVLATLRARLVQASAREASNAARNAAIGQV